MNVIEINGLVVEYGRVKALDGVSLQVRKGEIFGFLGPNGAGKSTTIKALLGLIPARSGSVLLHGFAPQDIRSRQKVGFLPEEATYYRFLTPRELLGFYGELFGIEKKVLEGRIQKLLTMVGLSQVQDRQIRTFSKGMVQKVSLAQALINEPETLILDEPMSGLDPVSRLELRQTMTRLKAEGKTLFFSSHELSEVELLCDSVAILRAGKLIRSGSLTEVLHEGRDKSLETFFLDTIKGGAS